MTCPACAAEIGASLLACPACHGLVHAETLRTLAAEARTASDAGDVGSELAAWREAMSLLPRGSHQHAQIRARVESLSAALITPPDASGHAGLWRTGGLVGAALFIWKFKAIAAFVLTKGKLLALGLTKSSTVFSMVPSLGVYWLAFGWQFAAGLLASIYVHEMGHVAALSRFGIPASAPMFIPGVGAVVLSRQVLTNVHEDARVGLAGPIWGLGAAVAAFGVHAATGHAIWAAIGQVGAWINLFNLAPVWQLDGAHAFRAMTRSQRWIATSVVALLFAWSREGLLIIVGLLAGWQSLRVDAPVEGDTPVVMQFVGLVAVLCWLAGLDLGAMRQ